MRWRWAIRPWSVCVISDWPLPEQAYREAVGYFEQAYTTDSTDKLNTFYLAMAHQRLGAYEEALFYFEQAKALMGAAALADIATQMGVALDALDRTGEAVEAFDLALRLDEKERDALFYFARLYDKRGHTEASRSYYSEFLSSVSEDEMPQLQDMARERLAALQAADSPELQASAAADTCNRLYLRTGVGARSKRNILLAVFGISTESGVMDGLAVEYTGILL